MPEETVRPLTIYVFNFMLKQFIVMNDVFFSSVTGGICGQKKKKMQVTAQKFVSFIEMGDSSVLSSFLPPSSCRWACRRHSIYRFWKMRPCLITNVLYEREKLLNPSSNFLSWLYNESENWLARWFLFILWFFSKESLKRGNYSVSFTQQSL